MSGVLISWVVMLRDICVGISDLWICDHAFFEVKCTVSLVWIFKIFPAIPIWEIGRNLYVPPGILPLHESCKILGWFHSLKTGRLPKMVLRTWRECHRCNRDTLCLQYISLNGIALRLILLWMAEGCPNSQETGFLHDHAYGVEW